MVSPPSNRLPGGADRPGTRPHHVSGATTEMAYTPSTTNCSGRHSATAGEPEHEVTLSVDRRPTAVEEVALAEGDSQARALAVEGELGGRFICCVLGGPHDES